jgi:putative flippase GtrA
VDPRPPERHAGASPVKYLVTAGASTITYLAVLRLFLGLELPYMVAIVAAQAVIIPTAFLAYRSLVFGPGSTIRADFARFLSVWIGGAVVGLVTTPLLVELAGLDPWLAQFLTIAVVSVASFVGHQRFSFRAWKR